MGSRGRPRLGWACDDPPHRLRAVRRRDRRRRPQRAGGCGLPRPGGPLRAGPGAAGPGRRRDGHGTAVRGEAHAGLPLRGPGLPDAGPADDRARARRGAHVAAGRVVHAPLPRRPTPRAAGREPGGQGHPHLVPRADGQLPRVRRLVQLLLRGGGDGAGGRADAPRAVALGEGPGRARGRRDLARLRHQAAGRGDRETVRRRHRARHRGDRRPGRDVRHAARPVAGAEPLLPLPAHRPWHRRAAGAPGRHGRAQRRARPGGCGVWRRDPGRRRCVGDPRR